ncbi:MAG: YdcF family protein [Pseudomonadota bacterium]
MRFEHPYDAIVVLGAAVWPGEQPSPSLKRRTLHAVEQHKAGKAPRILGSGGLGKHPPTEAEMIARICLAEGVLPDAILREDRSTSTLENVAFSARILQDVGARSVLVVTDSYHLRRAVMCFRHFGFECAGSAPSRGKAGTKLHKWIWFHIRELAALPYYYLKLRRL